MVRADLVEKIMSTINDTSKLRNKDGDACTLDHGDANTVTVHELRDDELQKVRGGVVNIERLDTSITITDSGLLSPGVINVLINRLSVPWLCARPSPRAACKFSTRSSQSIDELVTAVTAPKRQRFHTQWRNGPLPWRLKMHSAENTAVRELADAELNDVSGGGLAELIIALVIGMSGPNVGTIERQAAVLGMSHLL